MQLISTLLATLTVIASAASAGPSHAMESAAAVATNTTTNTTTPAVVPEAHMKYGYNPPRVNPEYCKGFQIDYPTSRDLAFEAGSHQYVKWSVNTEGLKSIPLQVFRIRIMDEDQRNFITVGEYIPLYNDKENKTGSTFFPLNLDGSDGNYHGRIMVIYSDQPVHCVYETVNFRVIHGPNDKIAEDLTPYLEENPAFLHSAINIDYLYVQGQNKTITEFQAS
ncbi:uncharacterized protein ATC70_001346 [Mucor velutinosus]|uniref:Uncharacterized protein n=1 Tax=Mucor velutinosus TaxID=708070 RepID=A0AAN7DIA5_9FUNG|nr:hypothetical protein ATC70_001346 [Mucor velutinosus]